MSKNSKLDLSTTSVRHLNEGEQQGVAGGYTPPVSYTGPAQPGCAGWSVGCPVSNTCPPATADCPPATAGCPPASLPTCVSPTHDRGCAPTGAVCVPWA